MINFLKKNKVKATENLVSCATGILIPLDQVKDDVFGKMLLGNGIAIIPKDCYVYAPDYGVVKAVFPTKHAITLELVDGQQVIIHIGVDTVNLKGNGFYSHVKNGQKISPGDILLSFEQSLLDECEIDMTIMLIFVDKPKIPYELFEYNQDVVGGQTIIANK